MINPEPCNYSDSLQILKDIPQGYLQKKINSLEIHAEILRVPQEEINLAMENIPKCCEEGFKKVGKLNRDEKATLCLIEKLSEGEKTQDIRERISFLQDFFWTLLERRGVAFQKRHHTMISRGGIILRKKKDPQKRLSPPFDKVRNFV